MRSPVVSYWQMRQDDSAALSRIKASPLLLPVVLCEGLVDDPDHRLARLHGEYPDEDRDDVQAFRGHHPVAGRGRLVPKAIAPNVVARRVWRMDRFLSK